MMVTLFLIVACNSSRRCKSIIEIEFDGCKHRSCCETVSLYRGCECIQCIDTSRCAIDPWDEIGMQKEKE